VALILNIETSTTLCSVALASGNKVLAFKEADEGYTHAENLHVFIHDVLKETKVEPNQLNAIAVGSGPGSYTGLRIGVSAAKGLAYALNIPLISVSTLQVMAHAVVKQVAGEALFCPMLDARRMEVYCAVFDKAENLVKPVAAQIVSEENLSYFNLSQAVYFFGNGMPKCKEVLSALPDSHFLEDVKPSSLHMSELSYSKFKASQFEDVAYFEPFYLKDFLLK